MPSILFLFFVAHSISWLLGFWLYHRWVKSPGGYVHKSTIGMVMAYCCVASESLPILGLIPKFDNYYNRDLRFSIGFIFIALVIGLIIIGIVCFSSRIKSQKSLGACPTESDDFTPGSTKALFHRARARLKRTQVLLGENLGYTVPLVLTESVHRPILVGVNPHRIYVPVTFVMQGEPINVLLEPLARFAVTRRYRAYTFLWWLSQIHVLLLPLTRGIRKALEVELSRDAEENPAYGPQFREAARSKDLQQDDPACLFGLTTLSLEDTHRRCHRRPLAILPVLALSISCAWGAWQAGGFNLRDFYLFMTMRQILGYSLHAYDPHVHFRALPGEGGLLPDGLMIDTRKDLGEAGCTSVRLPLGLLESENHIPFGAEAVNVHLEWKVLARGKTATDTPALKLNCSEQTAISPDGQQQLLEFYTRNVVIPDNSLKGGCFDIPIRLQPEARRLSASTSVTYGPVLFIPKGWKIEFRNYRVHAIPLDRVLPPPTGEGERFVAWYGRNSGKPATADFQWDSLPRHPGA